MKRKFLILFLGICFFSGCSKSNVKKDGVYSGEASSDGENKSTVKVTITLKDKKIVDVVAEEFDKNNKLKDESYGENSGDKNYKLAQRAVQGFKKYPQMLKEVQNIDDVDSVSGATVSHKLFKEAVKNALSKEK